MKKMFQWLLLPMLLTLHVAAHTAVFPFQVSGQNQAAWQWLGKACAYYLLTAYEQNDVPVLSEETVQGILTRSRIRFPFAMTKATAMSLAQEQGASLLIWGNVALNSQDAGQVSIRVFSIDLAAGSQREIPGMAGKCSDLLLLLGQLFRRLPLPEGRAADSAMAPDLGVSIGDYEKLVKSLLLAEPERKLELLLPLANLPNASDFILWEASKAMVGKGEWSQAESLLGRISQQVHLRRGKAFLLALAACQTGRYNLAQERFLEVQRESFYPQEIAGNLGVIQMLSGNPDQAERFYRQALSIRQEPDVWANLVYLLQLMKRPDDALVELSQALSFFPDDERLQSFFPQLLMSVPEKEQISSLFQEYVPNFHWPDETSQYAPALSNPYVARLATPVDSESKGYYIEARNHFLDGNNDLALSQLEQSLELNPYQADCYHLLALVTMQKKEWPRAEAAARAAALLKGSEENFLLLVKVLAMAGSKEKARGVVEAARKKFPGSKELSAVKIE